MSGLGQPVEKTYRESEMTEVLGGTSGDERIVELNASEPVDIAEGAAIIEEAVLEPSGRHSI